MQGRETQVTKNTSNQAYSTVSADYILHRERGHIYGVLVHVPKLETLANMLTTCWHGYKNSLPVTAAHETNTKFRTRGTNGRY
jgi:hypothetical protein